MDIKDALQIGDLAKGTIVAGQSGVNRKIVSIEVMEVPEVVSWVTPGLLIMTAFYSVKDNVEKQVEIVQVLIDKKAAGIVIKLGRFVEEIPEPMLAVAEKNGFPIITIPKEVSYINVLTPLYEKLYEEKKLDKEQFKNPFLEFETKEFSSLSDAIEHIVEIVKSPVYIEDTEGGLLYVSKDFHPDGWRKTNMLFSKPVLPSYLDILEQWRHKFETKTHELFKVNGFRNRIVVPLLSNKKVFANLHILYAETLEVGTISDTDTKRLSGKISELIMNEQLLLQKKRMEDMESLEEYLQGEKEKGTDEEFLVIHFQAEWIGKSNFSSLYLIDYSCLIRKLLHGLFSNITGCKIIIFEKYHNFYALLKCEKNGYADVLKQLNEAIDVNDRSDTMWVAVGPVMKNVSHLEDIIRSVDKTMEIGRKLRPNEKFYLYDKLGIYEILINLTTDTFVQSYIHGVLNPLLQSQSKELVETLEVYLNENGNVSKASEKLFIHRRTLTYRIQKIQDLLNMNVDNPENRFILRFCLNIKELSM